jgi:hypothetical protein
VDDDDYPGPTWAKLESSQQQVLWGVFRGLATTAWWAGVGMGAAWIVVATQTGLEPVRWSIPIAATFVAALVLEVHAQRLERGLVRAATSEVPPSG